MVFKKITRNFDGVEFESLRKVVDEKFNVLHDELSVCYYDFWRHEKSKVFDSGYAKYDVQSTVEESKVLFDKLHGAVGDEYSLKLIAKNASLAEKDRFVSLSDKTVKDEVTSKSEKDLIVERLAKLKTDDNISFDVDKISFDEKGV